MSYEPDPDAADLERALVTMDRVTAARILAGVAPEATLRAGPVAGTLGAIPLDRIDSLLVPTLRSIGDAWGQGRAALSQVYMAARIAEEIIDRTRTPDTGHRVGAPRIGIAVLEDHHELGKRIVGMTLRAAGYSPIDYGIGIAAEALADQVQEDRIEVLLVSTLMLRAALRVAVLAERLGQAGTRPRLVVGGAPYLFDDRLWLEVGADAMGRSAADAIHLITPDIGQLAVERPQ